MNLSYHLDVPSGTTIVLTGAAVFAVVLVVTGGRGLRRTAHDGQPRRAHSRSGRRRPLTGRISRVEHVIIRPPPTTTGRGSGRSSRPSSPPGRPTPIPTDLTAETARPLWMEQPPGQTVVAVDGDGVVLGSAKMGPNRPGRGAHVATASFMVDPAARARAWGGRWAATPSSGRGRPATAACSSTPSSRRTPRRCALWQSLGFEILTTVPEAFDHPEHGLVGLHVMFRRL